MGYAYEKEMYCYMPDARVCSERYSGEKKFDEENKSWKDKDGKTYKELRLKDAIEV